MRKPDKLLLVEDGSVDTDDLKDLEELGVKVIVYSKGARPPELWNLHNNDSTVEAIGFDIKTERDYNE